MISVEDGAADETLSQTQTMRLAAMMAISRLVDAKDLHTLCMSKETLRDGVSALQASLHGRAWGSPSIVFLPIDCLNSLANVSKCPDNRPVLLETGILLCYNALLAKWLAQRDGHVSEDVCAGDASFSSAQPGRHVCAEENVDMHGGWGEEIVGDGQSGENDESESEQSDGEEEECVEESDEVEEVDMEGEESGEEEGGGAGEEVDAAVDDEAVGEYEAPEGEETNGAKTMRGSGKESSEIMVVSGEVKREEVELAIAALGSLALLPIQHTSNIHTHSSNAPNEHASQHHGRSGSSGGGAVRFAFEFFGNSTLLMLLKDVGDHSHWHTSASVATSRLDWRYGLCITPLKYLYCQIC